MRILLCLAFLIAVLAAPVSANSRASPLDVAGTPELVASLATAPGLAFEANNFKSIENAEIASLADPAGLCTNEELVRGADGTNSGYMNQYAARTMRARSTHRTRAPDRTPLRC